MTEPLLMRIERLEKDLARTIAEFCAQQGIAARHVNVRVRITRGTHAVQLTGLEVEIQEPTDRIPRERRAP